MKKIGIFYGTSTGNTEIVSKQIADKLGIQASEIFEATRKNVDKLKDYDVLLFGSSTQGVGDLQDDWESFVLDIAKAGLTGKKVAVFGLGDSASFSDSFCGAIGQIAKAAKKAGATLIGDKVDTSDYTFDSSDSVVDGFFQGLALDEDNEPDKTEERIDNWLAQLKSDLE